MKFRVLGLTALVVCLGTVANAQTPLTLEISNGRVTLHAENVPVRTILSEWARLGGVKIINGDRVVGAPLTIVLEGVPERQALDIVLRGVAGFMLAARDQGVSGASMYDRIMILPTSAAPRNPAPTPAPPVFQGGIVRPLVPRADDGDDDIVPVTPGNDGVPLGRPTPFPRPSGAAIPTPVAPPVVIPEQDAPVPPQPPAGAPTATNPFGLPAGSSQRPGVITPAPPPAPTGRPASPADN